jgi:hypothetical protein
MNHSGAEGDEMLRAAALGRLDQEDPDVAARLAADPSFARSVAEIERTRITTERVMHEAAHLTQEAARLARLEDRSQVLATIEGLARGARAGRRRGRIFLLAGLAAAALLAYFSLRPNPPSPSNGVWLGGTDVRVVVERRDGHFEGLTWSVELHPGDELQLSVYAWNGDARGVRVLGPRRVAPEGWQPTLEEQQLLPAAWVADLERINGDDSTLLARVHSSAP